jgi:hypothetical protein
MRAITTCVCTLCHIDNTEGTILAGIRIRQTEGNDPSLMTLEYINGIKHDCTPHIYSTWWNHDQES